MKYQAIEFVWRRVEWTDEETGEIHCERAMVPTEPYRRVAVRKFGEEGTMHVLAPFEERNMNMHRACFAELNDLYNNLPETVWFVTDGDGKFIPDDLGERQVRFSNVEHFRHWLLIKEGWCHTESADSLQRAQSLARWSRDPFAIIERDRETKQYLVKRAVSQSLAEMSKRDFEDSMDAILARARSYVGITKTVSRRNAGRAA